jgi:hypothetical protein
MSRCSPENATSTRARGGLEIVNPKKRSYSHSYTAPRQTYSQQPGAKIWVGIAPAGGGNFVILTGYPCRSRFCEDWFVTSF